MSNQNNAVEVKSSKLGQVELPLISKDLESAFELVDGKASKKGLKATTLVMDSMKDLREASGLTGGALKLKAREYADQVAEWELQAMTRLISSGEWTAARRAVRVSGNGKGISFQLKRVEARVQPIDQGQMLKALGITQEQLAIAKQVKAVPAVVEVKVGQQGLAINA